jgi:hypothetical protein
LLLYSTTVLDRARFDPTVYYNSARGGCLLALRGCT